jgi:hypothetical protein
MSELRKIIANERLSKAIEDLDNNQLIKGKALPVGHINKWGEQKQPDGSWKYVGKDKIPKGQEGSAEQEQVGSGPIDDHTHLEKDVEAICRSTTRSKGR